MAAMGRLRSWKRELFARAIAEGKEPKKAYIEAGFKPSSVAFRNYNRLLRQPDVIARLNEFRKEREDRARAARVPIDEVLAKLDDRGIHQVADFFDRNGRYKQRLGHYRWAGFAHNKLSPGPVWLRLFFAALVDFDHSRDGDQRGDVDFLVRRSTMGRC
jgi:hypothetical protein